MNKSEYLATNDFEFDTELYHVPFFIHAPNFVKPKKITSYKKLVDVVPTAASLANISYNNYTLGSNALDTINDGSDKDFAFIYKNMNGEPGIGLLQNNFYYTLTRATNSANLYNFKEKNVIDIKKDHPLVTKQMDSLIRGYYNATKYLYYNNKKTN